jgi:hypothetical protein
MHDGLYLVSPPQPSPQAFTTDVTSLETWHQRWGHSS